MRPDPPFTLETLFDAVELRQVQATIRALWRSLDRALPSDVLADCFQEADLHLWEIRDRLRPLPHARQKAYAYRTVCRAVRRYLEQELRQKARALSLEVLGSEGAFPAGLEAGAAADWAATLSDRLLDYFTRPDLAEAFCRLSLRDQKILSFYFVQGRTDPEIGAVLDMTPPAVESCRRRALARLRGTL
jgi:RNA polymerase sigma factor (sigma-70 family)